MARCKTEHLSFLPLLAAAITDAGMQLLRASVYSKCGGVPQFPAMRVPVSTLSAPNNGRNDQTWAAHFARWYAELADVVLLVKDTHFDYPNPAHAALAVPFSALVGDLRGDRTFACARHPDASLSTWHVRNELWRFRLSSYRSAGADDAGNFSSAAVDLPTFLEQWLAPDEFARLAAQPLQPVCYGGSFAVRRESIVGVQRETWHKLSTALSREDNLEEGHFMERAWAAILSPPLRSHPLGAKFDACTRGAQTVPSRTAYRGALQYCLCQEGAAADA